MRGRLSNRQFFEQAAQFETPQSKVIVFFIWLFIPLYRYLSIANHHRTLSTDTATAYI